MVFESGHKIGSYRIVRLLGQGGMGAVYEVEHEQLGVHYALKAFTMQEGHVDILKKKFLAEGKVLARLRDPHLIRVFDLAIDEETGVPFFVMDLITYTDGTPHTLDDVELSDLEEDCIFTWFDDLCKALDYIHAQGIVHRDIKLGNVLLREDKHVMLSDFGVSRIFGEGLSREVNATRTIVSDGKTGTKLIMGTAGYMAPEVRLGLDATPAADSYSLGVMFVYLLTGIWYAPGSKVFKLLEALEYRWIDVLPRLLSLDPTERPTNLSELVEQLRSAPGPKQEKADESKAAPRWQRRVLFALAGAAVVAAAAVGYFVFSNHSAPATPTPTPAPAAPTPTPAPPAPTPSAPAASDDFDEAFSVRGIYEGTRQ